MPLGRLIEQARLRRTEASKGQLTKQRFCKSAGVSESLLFALEKGTRIPGLAVLTKLFDRCFDLDADAFREREMTAWLAAWVNAQTTSPTVTRLDELTPAQRSVLDAAATRLRASLAPTPVRPAASPRTLGRLGDFAPFLVVCGDRREWRPRSLADLFILSASITDLTWVASAPLGLVTEVRSDKLAVQLSDEELEAELGRTSLIVVGGPDVNWVARILNPTSLWRFSVAPKWVQWDRDLRARRELRHRPTLETFAEDIEVLERYGRLRTPESELVSTFLRVGGTKESQPYKPREIANLFRTGGFFDPADQRLYGQYPDEDTDHAVISIAPNPFAAPGSGHVAVLVAGVKGPGTAEALRMLLTEPDTFDERPLGGVIEVQIPAYGNWAKRFKKPRSRWLTTPYTPERLLAKYDDLIASEPAGSDETADLRAAKSFVMGLS